MQLLLEVSRDNIPACNSIRPFLGNDMINGQHDVSEAYSRILDIFNFDPMEVTVTNSYKSGSKIKNDKTVTKSRYVQVPNDGANNYDMVDSLFNPKWEDLGSSSQEWIRESNVPTYRYYKSKIDNISGNCIIFHINRTYFNQQTFSTSKYQNSIRIPKLIHQNNGKVLFLFATIAHIGSSIDSGHYITILSDKKGNMFEYDDTNLTTISKTKYTRGMDFIYKNATMLFYYQC